MRRSVENQEILGRLQLFVNRGQERRDGPIECAALEHHWDLDPIECRTFDIGQCIGREKQRRTNTESRHAGSPHAMPSAT